MAEETGDPSEARPRAGQDDAAWQAAMDWVLRLNASPEDAALRASWQDWLRQDRANGVAWHQAKEIWDLAPLATPGRHEAQAPRPTPLPVSRTPTLGRTGPARRRVLAQGTAIAAAAAGVAWLALPRDPAVAMTATGEIRLIGLPDGSRVDLDTDSAVRVAFTEAEREVRLLRGGAFFTVVSQVERPFVVEAGPARVTVLGTRFDLRLRADRLDIAVEEGRVGAAFGGRDLTTGRPLTAGQSGRLDLRAGTLARGTIDPAAIAPWRSRRLVVERWTVAEVLAEIGRYHPGRIVLRDEAFGHQRVNGSYDLSRPAEAVRAVVETAGGHVTAITPYLLLVGAG